MQSSWGQGYPYMQFNKYMQQPMLQGSLVHYNAFMQYPQYPMFQGQQFGRGYGKGKTGLGMWNQGMGLGQGWGKWNQGMGHGYGGGKWNTNMGLGFGNQFQGLSGFGGGWGQGQFMNPWINGVTGGIGGLGKVRNNVPLRWPIYVIIPTHNVYYTVDSRYIEVQETVWNISRYP